MVFLKTFPTSELSFSVMELHGIDYVNFFFKSLKSFLKFTVHVWLSPSLIRRRFFKKKRRERHRSVYTSFMRKGPLTSRVCVPLWFLVFYFKDFFFFWCGPSLKSLLNLLQYCLCFMFWCFGREACGILVPWPGIEPTPPALEGEVLTTGLPGKCLYLCVSSV